MLMFEWTAHDCCVLVCSPCCRQNKPVPSAAPRWM